MLKLARIPRVGIRCGLCRRQLDRLTVVFDSRYADPPGSDNLPAIYAVGRRGLNGTTGRFNGSGKARDSLPHIAKTRTGEGPDIVENWRCNKYEIVFNRSAEDLSTEFLRCARAKIDLELSA